MSVELAAPLALMEPLVPMAPSNDECRIGSDEWRIMIKNDEMEKMEVM